MANGNEHRLEPIFQKPSAIPRMFARFLFLRFPFPLFPAKAFPPSQPLSPFAQEVHIMPSIPFVHEFYGANLNALILGFIRPEYDYVSQEALVRDIKIDIEVALASLGREAYEHFRTESWLLEFPPPGDGKGV